MGAPRISVDLHKGEALLTFDQAYSWISLPVAGARQLAAALTEVADRIEQTAAVEPRGGRLS